MKRLIATILLLGLLVSFFIFNTKQNEELEAEKVTIERITSVSTHDSDSLLTEGARADYKD